MELKVGQKRNFSVYPNKNFTIKEILEQPEIEMAWTWDSGFCPHCKKRISREVNHKFIRIEILADSSKIDKNITIDDIVLLGDTIDNKKMFLIKDKYNEVFSKSKDFKKFIK